MENNHLRHEIVPINPEIEVRFYLSEDEGSYVTPHWHNSLEIVYMIEGSMEVIFENHRVNLQPTEFIIINQRTIHAVLSKKNKAFVLQIPARFLEKFIPDIAFYHFDVNLYPDNERDQTRLENLKKIFFDMHAIYDVRPAGYLLKFNSLLYELLFILIHTHSVKVVQKEIEKNEKYLSRLGEIVNYIDTHYARNLTIQELAGHLGYHPDYLSRFFKKHMGMTVLEYLYEVRINYVFKDIETLKLPVYEILEKHGCRNYKLAMRLFKARYGMTPKEKQKQVKYKKVGIDPENGKNTTLYE